MQTENRPKFPTTETINAVIAKAENNGNSELADALRTLFGVASEPTKDNRPVTERVKTFHDALAELGHDHPLTKQWRCITGCDEDDEEYVDDEVVSGGEFSDIRAYLQLRIITAALNEGWKPEFTQDEWRYFPWLCLYTDDEIAQMDDEQRSRVVYRSYNYANPAGGVAYASTSLGSAYVYAGIGSRLAFQTRELAIYAGQQFTEIYADFMFRHK